MIPEEVVAATTHGALLLDLRTPAAFAMRHVAGAISLQFNRADLADRASMMLPHDRSYVLMAEPDIVAKSADQLLSDAGFDIEGILEGGLSRWSDDGLAIESLPTMTVDELNESRDELIIVDVREGYEFNHIRIPDAVNHPSTQPWTSHQALPHGPLAIICADESRSTFVASVARALGRDARLVRGGMTAWLEGDRPTEGRNSGA